MARKNTTKHESIKQEKRVAKDLEAKVTVASGALDFQKADVRNDLWLIECKTTAKPFYSLTEKTWNKIESQAIKDGIRMPLMCIDLEDGKTKLVILKYLDFIGLDYDTKAQYLGNPVPDFIEASSVRITGDFINAPFPQELVKGQYPCYRRDIKFLNINKHLVIIPYEDFINISNME